jgi:hypothetical protein
MNMKMKISSAAILLLALAAAAQAETETACKLHGGSIVPLPAEACAKEGGTMVTLTVATPAAAEAQKAAPAPVYQLSSDPKLAAVQKPILELLNKPIAGKPSGRNGAETIARQAKFAECKLTVDEDMRMDYGNLFSARKVFKIGSSADFRALPAAGYGVLGETNSKGGALKVYAVYLERARKQGDYLSIAISVLYNDEYQKFSSPDSAPYWDAPRDDLWMLDEFGYVKANTLGNLSTDRVRVLYFLGTADEAAQLKKAFDDIVAVCQAKAQ